MFVEIRDHSWRSVVRVFAPLPQRIGEPGGCRLARGRGRLSGFPQRSCPRPPSRPRWTPGFGNLGYMVPRPSVGVHGDSLVHCRVWLAERRCIWSVYEPQTSKSDIVGFPAPGSPCHARTGATGILPVPWQTSRNTGACASATLPHGCQVVCHDCRVGEQPGHPRMTQCRSGALLLLRAAASIRYSLPILTGAVPLAAAQHRRFCESVKRDGQVLRAELSLPPAT